MNQPPVLNGGARAAPSLGRGRRGEALWTK